MEGCDPGAADRRVLIVGATNRPEVLCSLLSCHTLRSLQCEHHWRKTCSPSIMMRFRVAEV
jgi:hypothetical protein